MTEALKSTSITNLDATPITRNTEGRGAAGRLRCISEYITPSSSAATGSTYQLVRIPTTAVVKQIIWESDAMTAGKFNLSVYYSTSTNDGTVSSKQGVIVPTTGDSFFASDIDCASAVTPTDKTNESGNYTLDLRNKHLWDALGLSADPGGFFDIVAVCHTTAVTTGAKMGITVYYNE